MTHDEARELFTARIDDALEGDERARLERHLAGCPECRRELDRLERTVALLRQARPEHAPAGFAERVVAATGPPPTRRRLVGTLFRPLSVKLPLHAAAVVLVAITATWLFRATPELQEAQRTAPAVSDRTSASRSERPAAPPAPPRSESLRTPPATPGSEPPAAPAREAVRDSSDRRGAVGSRADQETRLRKKEESEPERPATPSPASPGRNVAAKARTDAADSVVVVAAWVAPDRAVAVQDLEVVVTRLGGTTLSRREEPDATVVEMWLPDGAWAAVARELEQRGRLRVDREPAAPGPVRATLRIPG